MGALARDHVHTHLREDKILFTCDFLGSHWATTELFSDDERTAYAAAKRYYAEIMMPFRNRLGGYIEKIEALGLDMIAPSHGPVHRRPAFILDAHKDWISDKPKNHAIVGYVSMHGSTKVLVDRLVHQLVDRGVTVTRINLASMDLGHMAMALVDAANDRPRILDGAGPAAPGRCLRRVRGQHAAPQGPLGHGHRIARLGRQRPSTP